MTPQIAFMMTDGLRPDALQQANTPNFDRLIARSSYTMKARSVMPSITLPCHASIFHSVPPTRHGITTNDWRPMARPVAGLIERAKTAGKRCVFIHNWEPLRDLNRPGMLYASFFADTSYDYVNSEFPGDQFVVDTALRVIPELSPDLVFIYWGTIDTCGHVNGWMSDAQLRQIEKIDGFIGQIFNILPEQMTILIHSDHGGHNRNHGTEEPEDMTIPWIICGPNIKENHVIQQSVSLLDTAPTIAHILDISPSSDWEGRVLDEIFVSDSSNRF